jgi:hypothetical protein
VEGEIEKQQCKRTKRQAAVTEQDGERSETGGAPIENDRDNTREVTKP